MWDLLGNIKVEVEIASPTVGHPARHFALVLLSGTMVGQAWAQMKKLGAVWFWQI